MAGKIKTVMYATSAVMKHQNGWVNAQTVTSGTL